MKKSLSMTFRPDIQGLRAIAVILVILVHADFPWVGGGYVGVDVFFVLSGFLITGLLLREYEATGGLALGQFYLRRLRRLLPALVVVVGVTAAMVIWLLPEMDGRSLLASLPFADTWSSNLFFALREQDYFNELTDKDVFLHTWSLGVEEQFYLLWPVLILGGLATTKILHLRWSLMLLVVSSFLISVSWSYWQPVSAFYMMPARIWQFALGGAVYLFSVDWRGGDAPAFDRTVKILLALGVILILGSAFLLDDKTLYPGYWAAVPSLGAALVILSGSLRRAATSGVTGLAHPLLVWLGDRSYSLYLWHWPVMVLFGSLGFKMGLDHSGIWMALLLTLLLSMLSYRWIELPFWKGGVRSLPPKTFLLAAGAMILLLLAVSFNVQRTPPDVFVLQGDMAASIRSDLPVIYQTGCDSWYKSAQVAPCVYGPADAPNTAVLFGDSVGAQWFSAWAQIFASPEWRLVVLTKSSCPMVDEDYFYRRIGKTYDVCRQWREATLKRIVDFDPRVIVVGSAATYDFSPEQWVDGSKRILARLSATAERVVLVSGTPGLGFDGPSCIARHLQAGNRLKLDDCIGERSTEKFDRVASFLSTAASGFSNVQFFNPVDLVCPKGKCQAVLPSGVPVFRDAQHLTDTFVRSTVKYLRRQLPDVSNTAAR